MEKTLWEQLYVATWTLKVDQNIVGKSNEMRHETILAKIINKSSGATAHSLITTRKRGRGRRTLNDHLRTTHRDQSAAWICKTINKAQLSSLKSATKRKGKLHFLLPTRISRSLSRENLNLSSEDRRLTLK